jgi:hypothetical protein
MADSSPSATKNDTRELFNKIIAQVTEGRIAIMLTSVIIISLLLAFIIWIFHKIGLKDESCKNLDIIYTTPSNQSYFHTKNNIKSDALEKFDNSYNSILINYYVKSSYNSCCGDGYKNNFVSLCALEKCIFNGCRFLDFEIYSYNNVPIVASSTANSNFIKETYNALLLSHVLKTITTDAFTPVNNTTKGTNCHYDPLILNFRVMSSNVTMLDTMSDLFKEYLNKDENPNQDQEFSLLKNKKDDALLNTKMSTLRGKIIIICHFNPDPKILEKYPDNSKLTTLKEYISLIGGRGYCNMLRYNDIVAMNDNTNTIRETKQKFTIVLPNLDNSVKNFDSVTSIANGCHAICMKHQSDPNTDSNLLFYNEKFKSNFYSWILKEAHLIKVAPPSFDTPEGTILGATPPVGGD